MSLVRWNVRSNLLNEVAVWINERKSAPGRQVLESKRFNQGRFSDAGLTDHVHMRKPIRLLDPEQRVPKMEIRTREIRNVVCVFVRHTHTLGDTAKLHKAGQIDRLSSQKPLGP